MSLFEYVVVSLLLFYVIVGAVMFFMQEQLMFQPRIAAEGEPLPTQMAGLERTTLQTADGHTIVGVRTAKPKANKPLVIGYCGNAQNAANFAVHLNRLFPKWNVAVFYYRGYAPSEGAPGEAAFFADAELVHDQMKAHFKPSKVALVGVSLGTGVATYVAAQREVDHLALVMPYDSIVRVAQYHYPWLPVSMLLTRNRFESVNYMPQVKVPVSVIEVAGDNIVPNVNTRRLVATIPNLESLITVKGTTHVGLLSHAEYDGWLLQKLSGLN